MLALFRYIGWRHMWARPLRTALTIAGIALGVALSLAIDVINGSTLGFFRDSVSSVAGKAKLTVSGGEAGFDEALLDVVKKVPGVKHAVPMIEEKATFTSKSGSPQTIVVLGIDLLAEQSVRTYKTTDEQIIDDPLVFLNQPDSIIVTQSFALENGLKIESPFEMLTAHGNETFTVRGTLSPVGPAKAYGGGLAIMDIDGARATFGKEGKIDRIDVVPQEGANERDVGKAIEAALGTGFRAEPPASQAEAFERMVAGYQGLLAFLGSLALVVAVFLVGNTMAMSVAERRKEIGVLRAVGGTRTGIVAAIVLEAVVLGVIGSAIGVVLGRVAAAGLVGAVTGSMRTQFVTPIAVSKLALTAPQIARAVGAGLVAVILATVVPARSTTHVDPVDALRGANEADAGAPRRTRRWAYLGLALLAWVGIAPSLPAALQGVASSTLPIAAMVGMVLAAPILVAMILRGVARWLTKGTSSKAFVMRLAASNLLRRPRRLAAQVVALTVALALFVVVATVDASFHATIGEWLEHVLHSDILVSAGGRVVSGNLQPLSDEIARELDTVPGVAIEDGKGARGLRDTHALFGGRRIVVRGMDEPPPSMSFGAFETIDRPVPEAGRALFHGPSPAALVSANFVEHFAKHTGDDITLETPTGPLVLRIVGVIVDFGSPEGVVMIDRIVYKKRWNDSLVTTLALNVAPGASTARVREEIDRRLARRGLVTTTGAEARAQIHEILDESFAYARAIELAALLVALLSLVNTAVIGVLERARELAMLRAVGMSRGQLGGMIVGEAALVGASSGVVAALLAAYVSRAWLVGSLSRLLGWLVTVAIPWGAIGTAVFAGAVVGSLAGWAASLRAGRIEIREALADG